MDTTNRSSWRDRLLWTPLLLLAACAGTRATDLGIQSVQFEDVRVPTRMRLVAEDARSHSVSVGSDYRYGDFEYVGSVPIEACADYLAQTMPQHRWTLVEDTGGGPERTIRFERGIYDATYTIERKESTTRMTVALRTHPAKGR